jgi:hypothetical protein
MRTALVTFVLTASLTAIASITACDLDALLSGEECSQDSDCSGDDSCDDGVCVECERDSDCDDDEECDDGECENASPGEGEGEEGEGEGEGGEGEGEGEGEGFDGALRLVDGTTSDNGRLEIQFGGVFGTICDDGFDLSEVEVACRELGFSGGSVQSGPVGAETLTIWLDDIACTGVEERLVDCPSNGVGVHNCSHSEDVGLACF